MSARRLAQEIESLLRGRWRALLPQRPQRGPVRGTVSTAAAQGSADRADGTRSDDGSLTPMGFILYPGSDAAPYGWGDPVTAVNAPLGTPLSDYSRTTGNQRLASYVDGAWRVRHHTRYLAGSRAWLADPDDPRSIVLSWDPGGARVCNRGRVYWQSPSPLLAVSLVSGFLQVLTTAGRRIRYAADMITETSNQSVSTQPILYAEFSPTGTRLAIARSRSHRLFEDPTAATIDVAGEIQELDSGSLTVLASRQAQINAAWVSTTRCHVTIEAPVGLWYSADDTLWCADLRLAVRTGQDALSVLPADAVTGRSLDLEYWAGPLSTLTRRHRVQLSGWYETADGEADVEQNLWLPPTADWPQPLAGIDPAWRLDRLPWWVLGSAFDYQRVWTPSAFTWQFSHHARVYLLGTATEIAIPALTPAPPPDTSDSSPGSQADLDRLNQWMGYRNWYAVYVPETESTWKASVMPWLRFWLGQITSPETGGAFVLRGVTHTQASGRGTDPVRVASWGSTNSPDTSPSVWSYRWVTHTAGAAPDLLSAIGVAPDTGGTILARFDVPLDVRLV